MHAIATPSVLATERFCHNSITKSDHASVRERSACVPLSSCSAIRSSNHSLTRQHASPQPAQELGFGRQWRRGGSSGGSGGSGEEWRQWRRGGGSGGRRAEVTRCQAVGGFSLNSLGFSGGAQTVQAAQPAEKAGDCALFRPRRVARGQRQVDPRGIVVFLGGAFIGAAPEVVYSLLLQSLADEGFLVLAAPYSLTFDHEAAARVAWSRLQTGLGALGAESESFASLPVFGVGHSQGALLHAMISSLSLGELPGSLILKGNALISFNNKPASEAIPYFNQVGPAVAQVAPLASAVPLLTEARNAADEALRVLQSVAPLPPWLSREDVEAARPLVEQVAPLLAQIAEGVSEFRPSPSETRMMVANGYAAQNTLLVKFTVDTLDETPALEEVLAEATARSGGTLEVVELTGTHATPAQPNLAWTVGSVYTPLDAIGQAARSLALADLRTLVRTIVNWMDKLP